MIADSSSACDGKFIGVDQSRLDRSVKIFRLPLPRLSQNKVLIDFLASGFSTTALLPANHIKQLSGMVHFTHNMVPLRFCYQIYSLLVIGCFCTGITLLGMAFVALYGMGGKELCVTISFITLYGILRLCIPPWSETRNELFFGRRAGVKKLALDKFTLEDTTEISTSCCCPICLHNFKAGDHISRTRVCCHSFHTECLGMWLPKSTTCPYCRQDLEEREVVSPSDDLHKPGSVWSIFDGLFGSFYT